MRSLVSLLLLLSTSCGDDVRPPAVDAGHDGGRDASIDAPASDSMQADTARVDASDASDPSIFVVDFATTAGDFAIEVHPAWAPNGAARFRELVEAGFFDGQRFFRVVPDFIVQWGLSGDPAVTAMWEGRTIADDPVVESNRPGYVSFAQTSDPNSRTTQLFINYADNSFLDAMGFAPFGRVVSGMESVLAINAEYGERPVQSQIVSEGEAYLEANFPRLTTITSARIR